MHTNREIQQCILHVIPTAYRAYRASIPSHAPPSVRRPTRGAPYVNRTTTLQAYPATNPHHESPAIPRPQPHRDPIPQIHANSSAYRKKTKRTDKRERGVYSVRHRGGTQQALRGSPMTSAQAIRVAMNFTSAVDQGHLTKVWGQ